MTGKEGRVVVFDGPDGVGKTLQVELAKNYLAKKEIGTHVTRASGGTPIGELLRKVSLSDTDRSSEVDVYISLAMHTELAFDLQNRKQAGEYCLVDRSPLSMFAYNVFGSELTDKKLGDEAFEKLITLWPIDVLIIFEAPQGVLNERRQKRIKDHDYFEKQDNDFHLRVQEGYAEAMRRIEAHPEWGVKLVRIDATSDADSVHQQVQKYL